MTRSAAPSPPSDAASRARRASERTSAGAADELAPHDLRLVPAALASWAVALAALVLGWGVGAVLGFLAAVVALVAAGRLRRGVGTAGRVDAIGHGGPPASGGAPGALAAGACAAAVGLVAVLSVYAVGAHPLRPATTVGASATLDLVVAADPRPVRSSVPGPGQVTVRADLVGGQVGGARWRSGGRVLVVAPAASWSRLLPGQTLTARGSVSASDRADLTVAVLRTRAPPSAVGPVPGEQRAAGALRDGLREAARTVLDEDPAGLLPGLVVGDTSGMPPDLDTDFRTAGLSHLTAVSGTNVAIVCGAVLLVALGVGLGPRTSAVLAGTALVGFVILARPSPSVLRAAVMGGVTVLALAIGRRRSVVPALAGAVILLLLADPALAADPGFALSVLATGALVLLAPGLVARLRARGVPPGVAEALAVPVAAHVVTAPLVAGLSGEVSLVAVVANLLAAPAVAPATVLGVLAAVVTPWWTGGAHALVWLATPAVSWLVWVGRRCAAVPDAALDWPAGPPGALLLAGVVVGGLVVLRCRQVRVLAAAVLVGVLLVLVPTRVAPRGWPPPGWSVVACDVGQGDALVLATGEPGRAVLVDAGPEAGPVDACLSRLGVRSLALVVLSHLHADHVGGLAGALRGRSVGAIALGPSREPVTTLAQVRRRAGVAGVPVVGVERGAVLRWPSLALEVLAPVWVPRHLDATDGTEVNNTSVVLRAHTPSGRVLLPGDVELSAQSSLLSTATDLHAEILKVPHHGSRSQLPPFLLGAQARLALVSVGRGNTYGHPNPGVVGLLARSGAMVRRTDESGDIAVAASPEGPRVVARGDPRPDPRRR